MANLAEIRQVEFMRELRVVLKKHGATIGAGDGWLSLRLDGRFFQSVTECSPETLKYEINKRYGQ